MARSLQGHHQEYRRVQSPIRPIGSRGEQCPFKDHWGGSREEEKEYKRP